MTLRTQSASSPVSFVVALVSLLQVSNLAGFYSGRFLGTENTLVPSLAILGAIALLHAKSGRLLVIRRKDVAYALTSILPGTYLLLRFTQASEFATSRNLVRIGLYGCLFLVLLILTDERAYQYFESLFVIFSVLSLTSYVLSCLRVLPPIAINGSRIGVAYGFTFSDFPRTDFSNLHAFRFYGISDEPGAYGLICFLLILANRFDFRRRATKFLLLCGVLTLSTLFFLLLVTYLVLRRPIIGFLIVALYVGLAVLPLENSRLSFYRYKIAPPPNEAFQSILGRWKFDFGTSDSGLLSRIILGEPAQSFVMGIQAVFVVGGIIGLVAYGLILAAQRRALFPALILIALSRTQFIFNCIGVLPLIRSKLQNEERKFTSDENKDNRG